MPQKRTLWPRGVVQVWLACAAGATAAAKARTAETAATAAVMRRTRMPIPAPAVLRPATSGRVMVRRSGRSLWLWSVLVLAAGAGVGGGSKDRVMADAELRCGPGPRPVHPHTTPIGTRGMSDLRPTFGPPKELEPAPGIHVRGRGGRVLLHPSPGRRCRRGTLARGVRGGCRWAGGVHRRPRATAARPQEGTRVPVERDGFAHDQLLQQRVLGHRLRRTRQGGTRALARGRSRTVPPTPCPTISRCAPACSALTPWCATGSGPIDAGVTDLRLELVGRTAQDRLATLERAVDLVRQVDATG